MGSLCFYEQNNLLDSQKWLWLILEHKTADPSVYLNIAKCWAEIQLALWGSSSSFSLGCEARNGWGAFLLRRLYQIGWVCGGRASPGYPSRSFEDFCSLLIATGSNRGRASLPAMSNADTLEGFLAALLGITPTAYWTLGYTWGRLWGNHSEVAGAQGRDQCCQDTTLVEAASCSL